ncbi:MAG: NUDIX domain-containing protein [Methanoregulaceae archaeon]|nr:NUDIX domain-containing protein [Methanoregulaceae archaeon]
MKRFLSGKYGRQTLRFYPAPFRAPLRAFAGLVFPWQGEEVLVCEIVGRGWCIPSGRVEATEDSFVAVQREALEEAGAVLDEIQYIGCYQITERNEVRWADCYTARVADLVEIQIAEESTGRRFMTLDELPEHYHLWNDLTDQVFRHAYEVLMRAQKLRDAS